MVKFVLIYLSKAFFYLVKKNEDGEKVLDKRVDFFGGKTTPKFAGGSYITDNKMEIEALLEHPWYGKEFKLDPDHEGNQELLAKISGNTVQDAGKDDPTPPENTGGKDDPQDNGEGGKEEEKDPENTENTDSDSSDDSKEETPENKEEEPDKEPESDSEGPDLSGITTVQEAAAYLKTLDPELKARDVNNKDKVLAVADQKGIEFPGISK